MLNVSLVHNLEQEVSGDTYKNVKEVHTIVFTVTKSKQLKVA